MTQVQIPTGGLFEQAKSELARLPSMDEPGWLRAHRRAAAEWFRAEGLPTPRQEAWRFLPLGSTLSTPFAHFDPAGGSALLGQSEARRSEIHQAETRRRVTLTNGRVDLHGQPGGAWEVRRLSEALGDSAVSARIERELSRRSSPADGFAALNSALFTDGLVAIARAGSTPAEVLEIDVVSSAGRGATASYPRVVVIVESGAEVRLVERHTAAPSDADCLSASVVNVVLEPNADLCHVRILDGTWRLHSLDTLEVHQGRDSRYRSNAVSLGGRVSRLDLRIALEGKGAETTLDGIYVADGNEIVDHHTFVDHVEPSCTSREHYRGIVSGKAHTIFDGTIKVRPGAQRTSARQENRNLILSGDAVIHSKPHLEIDADDVICSHGATVGQLNADELFYLRARGIGEEAGRALLIHAFAAEVLERVLPPWVDANAARKVLRKLPGWGAVEWLV